MAGNEKSPCGLRDIRQATGGLWESRERRRVRVTFMAKWVRLHPSEPLLWGNALHPFDFQLFRFLSCYFLFITQKRHTFVWRFCCASFSSTHFGPSDWIRTSGLLNPIQARYQTSPHPVVNPVSRRLTYISMLSHGLQVFFFKFLKKFFSGSGMQRKYPGAHFLCCFPRS